MLDEVTFKQWLGEFFTSKSNQLQYSNAFQPKRVEKLVLDLSVASPAEGIKVPIQFRSVLCSKIYSTAVPTTNKSGSVNLSFDYGNLMNLANSVEIFANDSFICDTNFAAAYLTWSAQSDTSIVIYFFVDIDYRAGSTKTQITGTVSVQEVTPVAIKTPPTTITLLSRGVGAGAGTDTYTVPAGYYGIASFCLSAGGGAGSFGVNTTPLAVPQASGQVFIMKVFLKAGDIPFVTTSAANGSYCFASIAIFPI